MCCAVTGRLVLNVGAICDVRLNADYVFSFLGLLSCQFKILPQTEKKKRLTLQNDIYDITTIKEYCYLHSLDTSS